MAFSLSIVRILLLPFLLATVSGYTSDASRHTPSTFVGLRTNDGVPRTAAKPEQASIRLEIPFSVNGQLMTLCGQIVRSGASQTIVSSNLFLYGPGAPDQQANYALPVAAYNPDGSIEFIGNLRFQYKTTLERKLVDHAGAAITLGAGPQAQLVSDHSREQAYTLYPADILYIRFTIDDKAGRGQGEVQLGGTKGPVYRYRIIPRK